ncbi:hypothetical protein [Paenimyroides baculatum]|uniref:Lipoprotein n=1 Tax=Paenimyroides baculatum TaxID=2608000 RepID=A0A5M6CSG8_9FLAO|nr:hypothetical protein [Paenimyroides baculatum]KAA5537896.1 hypothetical protein F0460_04330 [Paenimyroides baculatum]
MKLKFLYCILSLIFIIIGCNRKEPYSTIEIKKTAQNKPNKTNTERIKFISKYNFEQFPSNTIENKNSKIKLNTNQNDFSIRYKTMINQTYEKEPINFAGKYVLNYWGCGSPCQVGIAINAENGRLIEIPSANVGYKFQKNSRLLVINPPDSLDYYIQDCSYCKPEFYLLDTLKYKFVKLEE